MGFRGNHKNRRDANEADLFGILRDYGFQIHPMDTPCDSIANYMGFNYLVEIKNGVKAPLTTAQEKFRNEWKGQFVILATEEEAHAWASAVVRSNGVEFRGVIS